MTTPTTDSLAQRLLACRPGYSDEVRWHKFLLDSWTGGGGYCGRITQTAAGFWGLASEIYARASSELRIAGAADSYDDGLSYLDRFPREDAAKFKARRKVSHFGNLFRPLTALKLGFMRRVEWIRQEIPDAIDEWREDVDGAGTTFEELTRQVELRAAVLGWCPVLFDAEPLPNTEAEDGTYREVSRAQAREAGADRPRMIPLLPANVLDWETGEDGQLAWAKIRIDRIDRASWDQPAILVSTITVWTPDTYETWEIRRKTETPAARGDLYEASAAYVPMSNAADVDVIPKGKGKHGFGCVPLVSWRASELVDSADPLRGEPIHGDVALRNRRLFNLESEFDEHIRAQVFALLVVPTDNPAGVAELNVGTSNALPVKPDSTQGYAYVAPPESVAATFETRIEAMGREIYRSARVEWVRSSSTAESAASKRSEFDSTNAALSDLATGFAIAERDAYEVVAPILGVSDEDLDAMRIAPPDDFDVEALAEDLATSEIALRIDAGPTFRGLVLERVVQRFLGKTIDAETMEEIRDEIEEATQRAQSMAETMANDPLGLGPVPEAQAAKLTQEAGAIAKGGAEGGTPPAGKAAGRRARRRGRRGGSPTAGE